jgi:hypothetical protein
MKSWLLTFCLFIALSAATAQDIYPWGGFVKKPLIPFRIKDKWGYADTTGKIKIDPAFPLVHFFNYGFAEVMVQEGREYYYGLINRKGKAIIPGVYKLLDIANFAPLQSREGYRNVIVETRNRLHGLYSLKGELLLDTVYARIQDSYSHLFIVETSNRKYGVYSAEARKWIAQPVYDHVGIAEDGKRVRVFGSDGYPYSIAVLPGGPGPMTSDTLETPAVEIPEEINLADSPRRTVAPPVRTKTRAEIDAEIYAARLYRVNGKQGFAFAYRFAGDSIPPVYDSINRTGESEGEVVVQKNGKWGVVNSKNEEVIPFRYDRVDPYGAHFKQHFYAVNEGDRKSVVTRGGKLVATGYDRITAREHIYILQKNGLYGVLFVTGETPPLLIEPEFYKVEEDVRTIYMTKEKRFYVLKVYTGKGSGQYGYISSTGRRYYSD